MRVQKVSHLFSLLSAATTQSLSAPLFNQKGIQFDVKRDDLIHPIISGNKWRKLKHLLIEIEQTGFRKVATMGGMHSNFLHSISYICMLLGWQLELYVRGHSQQNNTAMLEDVIRWGVKIIYVDRIQFKSLRAKRPPLAKDTYWIPEGGFSRQALKGSVEMLMEVNTEYDYVITATATGTSLAGICEGISQLSLKTKSMGICVLNNHLEIESQVQSLIGIKAKPLIIQGYEFGGYAKKNSDLLEFMQHFEAVHDIPLEHVYSGKAFYAVIDLIKKNYFPTGSKLLLIHCGGLQGKRKQINKSPL